MVGFLHFLFERRLPFDQALPSFPLNTFLAVLISFLPPPGRCREVHCFWIESFIERRSPPALPVFVFLPSFLHRDLNFLFRGQHCDFFFTAPTELPADERLSFLSSVPGATSFFAKFYFFLQSLKHTGFTFRFPSRCVERFPSSGNPSRLSVTCLRDLRTWGLTTPAFHFPEIHLRCPGKEALPRSKATVCCRLNWCFPYCDPFFQEFSLLGLPLTLCQGRGAP